MKLSSQPQDAARGRRGARRRAGDADNSARAERRRWWRRPSPAPGTRPTATSSRRRSSRRPARRVTQSIVLGTDQVARLTAAKGNKPPFDVAFFDDAAGDRRRQGRPDRRISGGKSPNFTGLDPEIPGQVGAEDHDAGDRHRLQSRRRSRRRRRAGTRCGTRNTRAASASPRSTASSASRSSPSSTASRAAARPTSSRPSRRCATLLPNVGAIGANLGAFATLWQQEQIDIAPYNFNFVQTLKAQGRAGRVRDSRHRRRRLGDQPASRRQRHRARTSR